VAGVVRWTEHPSDEVWQFGDYAKEFARAYTELALPESKHAVPIAKILRNDEYLEAIEKAAKGHPKAGIDPADFELDRAGIWGGRVPALDKKANAFTNANTLYEAIAPPAKTLMFSDELGLRVHRATLRGMGPGVVVVEFGLHKRVKLWDEGTINDPAYQAYFEVHGYGGPIGVAWILDQPQHLWGEPVMDRRWKVLHEIGHTLSLQHYERTPSIYADEMESRPEQHDAADHACLMSYADEHPHQPHFCGRCNLNLRGWNVNKIPSRSREDA
jgi:hypothetical protein